MQKPGLQWCIQEVLGRNTQTHVQICTCICMQMSIYLHMYDTFRKCWEKYTCIHAYACMCIHMCTCLFYTQDFLNVSDIRRVCMCIYTCIFSPLSKCVIHIHMCVCVYVYLYIHKHTQILEWGSPAFWSHLSNLRVLWSWESHSAALCACSSTHWGQWQLHRTRLHVKKRNTGCPTLHSGGHTVGTQPGSFSNVLGNHLRNMSCTLENLEKRHSGMRQVAWNHSKLKLLPELDPHLLIVHWTRYMYWAPTLHCRLCEKPGCIDR